MGRSLLAVIAALTLWCSTPQETPAGDWPQILGPNRNGLAAGDEKLAPRWKTPPKTLWERPVGPGYSGPVVVGDRLILFHRTDGEEAVECLEARTGRTVWKQGYLSTFHPQVGGGDGPLCTPTVQDNRVVTFGAQGILSCYDLKSGEPLWTRNTHREFMAQEGYFGAGNSPLIVGTTIVVNVGGSRNNSGIVGFDLETGKTKWQYSSEQGSYSAPIATTIENLPRVVVVTRLKCIGLEPDTGGLWFQFPFGSRGPTVNGATPLILPTGELFLTSSYGVGATLGKLNILGCDPVYSGDEIFASQYATPIESGGLLYGINGRDDIPPADLKCFDPIKRKTLWTEQHFGYGTLIGADNKLIILKTDGDLILAEPNPAAYVELGRTRLFNTTTRPLPALSRGILFARDETTLKSVDLR